ncbi:MAG: OadG family protein [Akkermansia sp.]|nr:OadG family protein [Akkermansia sp.]MBQ6942121.1 OadG family protein [Akkermansia sp.]MBQ7022191.1 OadG family protein [Akkermansia sp.]
MNITQTLAITWPEFMDALTYQVTGMLVVFCCLGLLCIILSISGAVAVRLEEKKKAAAEATKAAMAAAAPAAQPVAAPELAPAQVAAIAAGIYDAAASSITPEVVAAIAAAVKVTIGDEARILDIKPVDTAYGQSGRTSIMNSHNINRG